MSHRVQQLLNQMAPAPTAAPASNKKADDIVIVSALRTCIGRAKRGCFKDTFPEELLSSVIKGTLDKTKIDPTLIGDIVVGTVLGAGSQRATQCRMGAFMAGVPSSVPIHTINRQCSSGLQAIAHCAANIKAGMYDIGLACGVETMSMSPMTWEGDMNPKIFLNKQTKDCLLPMGITSENVAAQFNVTRKEQDELAVMSHARAAAAIKAGKFKDEIVPMKTKVKDAKAGTEKEIIADTDDGVRAETTFASVSKLKPAFQAGGTTTAANSSQVSDGAAAVLLMTRERAQKMGLPIQGVFRSFAVTGVEPNVMGIGPAVAIPEAVKKAGLQLSDIDLFEINEAFASQAVYSVKKLGLTWDNVNVNGGAIALGHPLGCTGARMTATLLNEMGRRKSRFGIVSMCIGSGMGAAAVFEKEY